MRKNSNWERNLTMQDSNNEYTRWIGIVLHAVYRDRFAIAAFTIIIAALGAAAGKLTNTAESTASLLLTPLALQQQTDETKTEDQLSKMLSEPLDVTTVSLICKSDETLTLTMDKLNGSGKLESPIEDLNILDKAIEFEITVSKDTPYLTEYSPILKLMVNWGDSAGAKLIADTWAEACVERAAEYQKMQQKPAADAFNTQKLLIDKELSAAEVALEAFMKDNNPEYLDARIIHLTQISTEYLKLKYDTQTDLAANRAIVTDMQKMIADEVATRTLNWHPSGKLIGLIDLPKGEDSADTPTALSQEVINPLYDFMKQRLAVAESSVAEFESRLLEIDLALAAYDTEMKTLQAQRAQVKITEARLQREVGIIESAYKDAAAKYNYAMMASNLDQPVLHLFSKGAEWRMPRFRRAILFGASASVFAFGIAIGFSLFMRVVLQPALKQSAQEA